MMASAMERQPATLVTPPGQNKSLNFTVCKYVRAFHQKTTTVNITFQLPAQRGQLTAWTHKTTRVSFLLVWAYSKMTIAGFIRHTLWKSGSASMRHYFHTVTDLNTTDNVWDVLEKKIHSSIQDLGEKYSTGQKWMNLYLFFWPSGVYFCAYFVFPHKP